ncbi:MAG: quinone-dependent dihydroorotate dehydrogenase [Flavobacteriales bacterium]|nr:quinone-dependent dihydroorotate dehydrogenase [Flavobacteriales bacterium]
MYKTFIKPYLFRQDPEEIHYKVFRWLNLLLNNGISKSLSRSLFSYQDKSLKKRFFGLDFPNPIGLAAGFDKDAKLYEELACLGFGFIEIGTVTPKPQDGNPKPRLFRLPQDEGLINRMGFNNSGVEAVVERLKGRNPNQIIGGNIGKNKITPNENALDDYLICFEKLFDHVDYFVVNVSSPNTPNLRDLQEKEPLMNLLNALQKENNLKLSRKPILLKIAPDLTNEQLDDIIDIMKETKIDGLIATNTTIDRSKLKTDASEVEGIGAGGLSGKPVRARSTEVIKYLSSKSNKAFPIVAVGGIFTAEDAIEKLKAGADLLQVYTGFIYEGPAMVKKINKGIASYYKSL